MASKKEQKDTNKRTLLILAALFAVIGWIGLNSVDTQEVTGYTKFWVFLEEMCLSTMMLLVVVGVSLVVMWVAMFVRSQIWYDTDGAGLEVGKVQDRVNQGKELPGDNVTCGIKYAAGTIFLAVILLAKFMQHTP